MVELGPFVDRARNRRGSAWRDVLQQPNGHVGGVDVLSQIGDVAGDLQAGPCCLVIVVANDLTRRAM
jgi:hypothetical protein